MSEKDDLERKLSEMLVDGEMEQGDRIAKEIREISPKYEIVSRPQWILLWRRRCGIVRLDMN